MRDVGLWKYTDMAGAVNVFQSIVGGRSWTVGGKPDSVMTILELLHRTESKNTISGHIEYGLEAAIKRQSIDVLAVGRTVLAMRHPRFGKKSVLEYVDPTVCMLHRNKSGVLNDKNGRVIPPSASEKIWFYDSRWYRNDEIFLHHPVPIGSNGFIAPLTWLIPLAELAFLLDEHHRSAADGRKIRNLLFTPKAWKEDISTTIEEVIALYGGGTRADSSKNSVPIVGYGKLDGKAVSDMLHFMKLSNIEESFDQEQFWRHYISALSAATGVSVRHFWSDDRGSNRALELVQVQREQLKGPASFIRSLERMLNNSGMLERASSDPDVRMNFIEEVDTATMKAKAEVIELYAVAAEKLKVVFGATFSLQSFLGWLQRDAGVPYDIQLEDVPAEIPGSGDNNEDDIAVESDASLLLESEVGGLSDESTAAISTKSFNELFEPNNILKRVRPGEIIVNQDGDIVDSFKKNYQNIFIMSRQINDSWAEKAREEREKIQKEVRISLVEKQATIIVQQQFDKINQNRIQSAWGEEMVKGGDFKAFVSDHLGLFNKASAGMWLKSGELDTMDSLLSDWFDKVEN